MPGKKVEFCEGTKPPNQGAMKILTLKIKDDVTKIKRLPELEVPLLNTNIPLIPAVPELEDLILIDPLDVAVPSPLSIVKAPPVKSLLRPDWTRKYPPAPHEPLPIKREPKKIIHVINMNTDTPYNKDIVIIMSQTNVTREVAVKVYEECEEDLVNSIMYIVQEMGVWDT